MYKLYSIIRKNTIKTPKKLFRSYFAYEQHNVYAVIKYCDDHVRRVLKYIEEYDAAEKSI